jgi:hypothetical protein
MNDSAIKTTVKTVIIKSLNFVIFFWKMYRKLLTKTKRIKIDIWIASAGSNFPPDNLAWGRVIKTEPAMTAPWTIASIATV